MPTGNYEKLKPTKRLRTGIKGGGREASLQQGLRKDKKKKMVGQNT